VLSARSARRHGVAAWRGLVGRANGGMVVHLGGVVIAVALTAATSFAHRGEVTLRPGQSTSFAGSRIGYEGLSFVHTPSRSATEALVTVNGHGPYTPAVSQFGAGTEAVGTPAIDSSAFHDVYLTVDDLPLSSTGPVTIGVTVQPLVAWLWLGGAILAIGAVLAAVPGRRRRPTDPVSALVPGLEAGDGDPPLVTTVNTNGGARRDDDADELLVPPEDGRPVRLEAPVP
jgi:cytochrome c-type biogenesis protein CcmF